MSRGREQWTVRGSRELRSAPEETSIGPIHYEVSGEDHQHAICQVCGGVLHIEHSLVAELEQHLQELHRFRPVRTDVLVVGVCNECARGRRPARSRVLDRVHYGRS